MATTEKKEEAPVLATKKVTYRANARAKARPTHFIDPVTQERVAIGREVTITKPLRGTFTYREVTSQAELKKYYESGMSHLIDAVSE